MVTALAVAICVSGTEAAALTLPVGPTDPVSTLPSAPTGTTLPSAPTLTTPKVTTPKVTTPRPTTPRLTTPSVPKVSSPPPTSSTITKQSQQLLSDTTLSGGGSSGSTGTGSTPPRLPLRSSVSATAPGTTTSGDGLTSLLGGTGGGGAAGPGTGAGASGTGPGSGPAGPGGPGALGGGSAGSPAAAAAAILLRAEAGLSAAALTGVTGAAFEALRVAVASLAGCVGQLDPLEQRMLVLRFGLGGGSPRTLGAVARRLGISRAGALRVERRALQGLRVGSSSSGCAAGSGLATVFDPTTIGMPVAALLGASAPAGGYPASRAIGAGVAGAATPVWPGLPHSDIGWLLTAIATLGALLMLAGVLARGWVPPLPWTAPAASRALARVRRPAGTVGRRAPARGRGPQPLAPRVRYRRRDRRSDT